MTTRRTVLIVGATGSVGRLVTEEAVQQGYQTRALVRSEARGRKLPPAAQIVVADLTDPESLVDAVDGIDAVVFTQGTHGAAGAAEAVDYGAVANVLTALDGRPVRIALMTAIGVTVRSEGHDWKRRGERLVRASGNAYTIVRPGWFDYNAPDQLALSMLQGDTRRAENSSDGAISRRQLAQVLVDSLSSEFADHRTFELVAEHGPAPVDLNAMFAALNPDTGGIDGVRDPANLPLESEPERFTSDLSRIDALFD